MYPKVEIGFPDGIGFGESASSSPSPSPQPRRLNPYLRRRHRRAVRPWMASSHSLATPTGELPLVRKRSKKSTPSQTGGDGAHRDDAPSNCPRLSWKHLKQVEIHQKIRHHASELARLSDDVSGQCGDAQKQPVLSDVELRAMTRLSHDIADGLSEIRSLRNRADVGSRDHVEGVVLGHAVVVPKARRSFEFRCHKCHCTDTPQWRHGPDGPMTLCNVCGLVYAKRQQQSLYGLPASTSVGLG